MPDFAPDATPRMRFGYTSAGFQHHILIRCLRDGSLGTQQPAMEAAVGALTTALASLLPEDFVYTTGEFAAQDSDVFDSGFTLPAQPTGTQALSTYTPIMRGTATTFKGKGGGSKISVSVFGVFWDPSDTAGPAANGRVEAAEDATVAAAITALSSHSIWASIANAPVNWYNFATVKPNDHYVKLARKLFP